VAQDNQLGALRMQDKIINIILNIFNIILKDMVDGSTF
jgi:hypothetical protein